MFKHCDIRRTHVLSITEPVDISGFIEEYCEAQQLASGYVSGIGAIRKLVFSFYDFKKKKYLETTIEENLEMISLTGNISLKDGKAFPHLHVSAGKRDGTVLGGHCAPGTIVYPGELFIFEMEGKEFQRKKDEETGLYLWHC